MARAKWGEPGAFVLSDWTALSRRSAPRWEDQLGGARDGPVGRSSAVGTRDAEPGAVTRKRPGAESAHVRGRQALFAARRAHDGQSRHPRYRRSRKRCDRLREHAVFMPCNGEIRCLGLSGNNGLECPLRRAEQRRIPWLDLFRDDGLLTFMPSGNRCVRAKSPRLPWRRLP